ncbi:signal peptidase I [Cyanobium sp. WAJ14-Wanaka]|uniref:signal peptidase I n=1 Tax=Cyanobium sp. WAJ14-Wanaka TaxID=2823725 RepID=UPI0020CF3E3D|nr:signal peptidase I [Cyanobium sp. WAJ14-Wanaka]MCP9774684.1 signal peptidase I [Cyanobium sp. WAJ14-Wanaka]
MVYQSSRQSLTSDSSQRASWAEILRRQVVPILAWVGVALLLRWAVLEPRWIPSGSMLPNLQIQDRVLVEKVRSRLGMPLPLGTVVVFHAPQVLQEAGYDPNAALIKRVVGIPGDRVEVKGGQLWRNGLPVAQDWATEAPNYQMAPVTVPPESLLVMGDNRNSSLDSHLWGPLANSDVIGTAVFRYWPLARFGLIRTSPPATAPGPSD